MTIRTKSLLSTLSIGAITAGSANAAVIDYLDTWTGTGSTRTQTIDIDGISTIVTLTAASSVGDGNLSFNNDAVFGGWGVDLSPDGIHGSTSTGAVESLTISLAPVSGTAVYTFESVSLIGIGANGEGSTTVMNVGNTTLDVIGTAFGTPASVVTTNTPQETATLVIDYASTTDTDEAGAFWRSATISAVPEPGSLALLGLGGLLVAARRRRD